MATPRERAVPPFKFTYQRKRKRSPSAGGGGGGGAGDIAAAPPASLRLEPSSSSPPRSRSRPEAFAYNPSAGSNGGGGEGGAAPAPTPRPDASSPPRSPSPPEAFTYNPSAESNGGGDGAAEPPRAPQLESSPSPPSSPSSSDDEVSSFRNLVPPFKFTYQRKRKPSPSAGGGGGGGAGDIAAAPPASLRPEPSSSPPRSRSRPEAFAYNPSAGSSGGGGVAAPPPAPRPDASSPPRSPSPPEAFTYNPSAESNGGGDGDGAAEPPHARRQDSSPSPPSSPSSSDDEDYEDFNDDENASGWGSLFMSDRHDPQDLFQYIGRQNCEPLITRQFFSLRHNWQLLLDGKKTYLRPPKNNLDAYDDDLFVTPKPLQRALGCQEPLSVFVHEATENRIIQEKFKILSDHYVSVRQMRVDGSSFYRAFLFSYLENLGKMHDSEAEVTRLMECVARSREDFCRLQWNNAYFSNPEAFFASVVSEFEHLVTSVARGLSADELYKRSLHEITSSRIISLLRLLIEVHIRSHYEEYKPPLRKREEALLVCVNLVRPFDAEADMLQMKALSNVLGIPLHLSLVDTALNNGIAQVKCFDFFPQSESRLRRTLGPLRPIRSYYLSRTTDKHPQQGRDGCNSVMPAGNLLSSDHMPLVTLLKRSGQFDILYRK